jgi:restriction system protein
MSVKMETCSNCNYTFPENDESENDVRKPCPKCGSTKRTYRPSLNISIQTGFQADPTSTINSAPPLSFGVIINFERTVPNGQVITLVDPIYTHLISEIGKNTQLIYQIDSRKWEEIIAAAYDKAGFDEVILTPRSGDLGRDVIAIKYGFGSVKFIDQVKAYSPGHVVKADEVRALLGVLQAEQDASKAIFTTTTTFAPKIEQDRLIKPYLPYRLELVNKEKLLKRLIQKD